MSPIQTRYARTADGVYLGYQVAGDGPIDLVWQPDWPGNIDMEWEFRVVRHYLEAFSSFSRLVLHDHRGVGISSRDAAIPNLETRVADLLTVLDAVGVQRPSLVGWGSSASVHALLASTRPELISSLVWMDATPRTRRAEDYPWGRTNEELDAELHDLQLWGTEEYSRVFAEEQAEAGTSIPDEDARAFAKASRNACTPDVAIELSKMWAETDVRDVLPSIRVPTLFLSQPGSGDRKQTRDAAARVPGSEYVEIEGTPYSPEVLDATTEAVRRFVGATRPVVDLDTVLATILFTDIVDSTAHMSDLGDRRWKALAEQHHSLVRQALGRWHGVEVDTAGDGFYATFDGPARAIRCALEIVERVGDLGVDVRSGVHTGECRVIDGKLGGVRPHRCADRSDGRQRRGPRVADGEGPRGRERVRVRSRRCTRAQRCAGPLGPVSGRAGLTLRAGSAADGTSRVAPARPNPNGAPEALREPLSPRGNTT